MNKKLVLLFIIMISATKLFLGLVNKIAPTNVDQGEILTALDKDDTENLQMVRSNNQQDTQLKQTGIVKPKSNQASPQYTYVEAKSVDEFLRQNGYDPAMVAKRNKPQLKAEEEKQKIAKQKEKEKNRRKKQREKERARKKAEEEELAKKKKEEEELKAQQNVAKKESRPQDLPAVTTYAVAPTPTPTPLPLSNVDLTNQQNAEKKKQVEDWANRLVNRPSLVEARQFFSKYFTGEITAEDLYRVITMMARSPIEDARKYAVLGASLQQNYQSFDILVEISLSEKVNEIRDSAIKYLDSYRTVRHLSIMKDCLEKGSLMGQLAATEIIDSLIQGYSTTVDDKSKTSEVSQFFKPLLPVLEKMSQQSLGNELQSHIGQTLASLQKLITTTETAGL